MHRDGKPQGFFYLDHRTVDGKCNIITDVYVTPGNINDATPYVERIITQMEKFNFDPEAVSTDSVIMRNTPIFICFLLIVVFILGMIITAQNRRINDLQKVVDEVAVFFGEGRVKVAVGYRRG